jgi:predicted acetyltransferase
MKEKTMTDPVTHIRSMPAEEMLEVLFPLASYAFHPSPPFRERGDWNETILARKGVAYFALFEGDTAVATVASTQMTQQVRGEIYDAGGVWGVVTHPAARRKGYCKRLMARLLAADREEGRVLSCLYPFKESFYDKFGYVTFPLPRKAKLKPAALSPLLKRDLGGQVELVLVGDGYDTYRDYVQRLQRRTHGLALFVHGEKERVKKDNRSWVALAKVDGQLVGLMLYDLHGQDVGEFTLRAHRFYYDTSQGKYLLLQWIARHVDQVSEVELWLPPFEHPEAWLTDMRVVIESQERAPMDRVVDVAKIGGMQTGSGCFTARIVDPLCPWNEGRWKFETVDGILQVSQANELDCDLSIHALTALIYGTHDPGDFAIRGWGNPSAEMRAAMQTMFPPLVPFLHEYF